MKEKIEWFHNLRIQILSKLFSKIKGGSDMKNKKEKITVNCSV